MATREFTFPYENQAFASREGLTSVDLTLDQHELEIHIEGGRGYETFSETVAINIATLTELARRAGFRLERVNDPVE